MSLADIFVRKIKLDDSNLWDKYIKDCKIRLCDIGSNREQTQTNYLFLVDAPKISGIKFILAKHINLDVGVLFIAVNGVPHKIDIDIATSCRLLDTLRAQSDKQVSRKEQLDRIRSKVFKIPGR